MRYLIVTLMMALLPVRAWLGDAMALSMAVGDANAMKIVAASAEPARAGSTFSLKKALTPQPCHEAHGEAHTAISHLAETTPSADHTAHSDCNQCSTCQICHSVVLSPPAQALPLLALPTQLAHSNHALFASVPRAPHLKPPIS